MVKECGLILFILLNSHIQQYIKTMKYKPISYLTHSQK